MDRKHSKYSNTRASRPKKRKAPENRHTREGETSFASKSAKKLATSGDEEIIVNPGHGYRIIAFLSVFTAISELVICKQCEEQVQFGESSPRCLGFKIAVQCKCGVQYIDSCPLVDNKACEINRRMVLVMRLLGIGREGINLFCGLMDLSQGIGTQLYYASMENIHSGAKAVYDLLTKKATNEEKIKNVEHGNPTTDISVFGDATWQKSGPTLYGITTLIGKYTGKVVDLVVKFSESKSSTDEYDNWSDERTANHESAKKMKLDSIKEMFRRSLELHEVRYANYIGDGDIETFKALLDDNPYGDDLTVTEKVCVEYVQKRMGLQLMNEGKLTGLLLKELTTSYGLAIRSHPTSIVDMHIAVLATFHHNMSTNENPQHKYCPAGPDSWCKWRKAQAEKTLNKFNHEPLDEDVESSIEPIYKDFSSKQLLEKCLGAETLSYKEGFNSAVWRFAPKHLYCRPKTIETVAYLTAGVFNEGLTAILKTMTTIGIVIGEQTKIFANVRDKQRLVRSSGFSHVATKDSKNEFYEAEEMMALI